ncbi:Cell wall-associated polypeptide CWBP200 [Limihaloglobus sulfuriphilus]|uniref:Cell wall-associated polypeptide CWBP200 n=1 Tax=Limihaloglobus sulfuriphilus TaxID=1851148 RepID=A0A1Q2MH18_9BACT|nr:RHS repeat-associated core domain-containing protein [Limihaloglobus sulfuriphilus]AQQ71828.1 Cell wall-associated polypeptide CWBP200 [Limihaloglobus sulfuriphilus]
MSDPFLVSKDHILDFDYTYESGTNNIASKQFGHRSSAPATTYTYDDIDRLLMAQHLGVSANTEDFTNMDDLGNRDGDITIWDESTSSYDDIEFAVDPDNNQYNSIDNKGISYDNAGNMTEDIHDYTYTYDYENRLVRIEDGQSAAVAQFCYDALGRRIMKDDNTMDYPWMYYYDNKGRMTISRSTVSVDIFSAVGGQGPLREIRTGFPPSQCQAGTLDLLNLHSVVAIANSSSNFDVVERCEYDAYGNAHIFTAGTDGEFYTGDDVYTAASAFGNEYTFTGRRLDTLDSGNLRLMYYRNRYYSPEIGRFLQKDPHGINPDGNWNNPYSPRKQFTDGTNLYLYANSDPVDGRDEWGLFLWSWEDKSIYERYYKRRYVDVWWYDRLFFDIRRKVSFLVAVYTRYKVGIAGYSHLTGTGEVGPLYEFSMTTFQYPDKLRLERYKEAIKLGYKIPCKALYQCITDYCNGKTSKKNQSVKGVLVLTQNQIHSPNIPSNDLLPVKCEHSKEDCDRKCKPYFRPFE